mgnify:CR=1 FL=1
MGGIERDISERDAKLSVSGRRKLTRHRQRGDASNTAIRLAGKILLLPRHSRELARSKV